MVTNLLILAFTSSFLDAFQFNQMSQRIGFFVATEHLVLFLKLAIDWASPHVPSNVRKSVARDEWLAKRSFKLSGLSGPSGPSGLSGPDMWGFQADPSQIHQ